MKSRLLILWLHLLSRLPLGFARRLGRLMGNLLARRDSRMARTTRTNLGLCMPELDEAAREALARESLRQTCSTIMEAGAVWLWPAQRVLSRTRVANEDLLRDAHARGKGVIVIGPHLGNWEVLGLYLNACELGETLQMFQAPKDPALGRLIYRARSRAGATMVATDAKGVSRMLRGLRQGMIAGILPDQVPPTTGGAMAPFFGQPALTMTLLSKLIAKTGCEALVGYARRIVPGQDDHIDHGFEIVFMPADPRLFSADLDESLSGLNASIEAAVRQDPALYQWEYKRFRRQADGRNFYDT